MNFQVSRSALLAGLSTVAPAVGRRSGLPILQHIKLELSETGELILSASNLKIAIQTAVSIDAVDGQTALTLPASLLIDLVNSLPDATISMSIDGHDTAHLTCGDVLANIKGLDAEGFPVTPSPKEADFILPPSAIRQMAKQTTLAAATDESRPILTGVQLVLHADDMAMAGADGFRLSLTHTRASIHDDITLVVPAMALTELVKLLSRGATEGIGVNVLPSHVVFSIGPTTTLTTQLLEGNFPDCAGLIPGEWTHLVVVDRDEMVHAVEVAGIFSRRGGNVVRVRFSDDTTETIQISAVSSEIGDNTSTLNAQITRGADVEPCDEFIIGLNTDYLLACMKAMPTGDVAMKFTTPSAPVLFEPHADDEPQVSFRHVIMPMLVRH